MGRWGPPFLPNELCSNLARSEALSTMGAGVFATRLALGVSYNVWYPTMSRPRLGNCTTRAVLQSERVLIVYLVGVTCSSAELLPRLSSSSRQRSRFCCCFRRCLAALRCSRLPLINSREPVHARKSMPNTMGRI